MTAPTLQFVSRKYPPAMGGMETYALRLSERLERHSKVTRIVLPGRVDGRTPTTGALLMFGLRTAVRLATTRSPAKIVHVGDMASWPLAFVARLRSRKSKIALSAHGTDVSYAFRPTILGRLYGLYMRIGARLLGNATVICNSQATLDLTRRLGFRRLFCVPLATDLKATPQTAPNRRILFAGRLIPQKGCRWFIETVLPHLPEDITLDVAGALRDPEETKALEHPRVTYLGILDPGALARTYGEALCVIVPNIDPGPRPSFEGFGLVAVEAAAAGGIVLAAAHSGLNDAVIDGVTGRKLPSGKPEAWIAAITDIAAWSPDTRAEAVARATKGARAQYSWDRVARETFAAYG